MSSLRKDSNVDLDGHSGRMIDDHGSDDDDNMDNDDGLIDGIIPSTATAFPTTEFTSIEDAVETCRSIAINAGFALSIRRSNKDKLRAMVCDRNGASVPRGVGLRATGSRRIGCPFLLKIRRYGSAAHRFWIIVVDKNAHNHELTPGDMSSHCMARKLTNEQLALVEKLHIEGFRPRQILQGLKDQFPDTLAVRGDIYNALANIRRKFSVSASAPPFHSTSPGHRLCSNCKEEGHDVRACPHANLAVAPPNPLATSSSHGNSAKMPPRVPTPRTSSSSTTTPMAPAVTPAPVATSAPPQAPTLRAPSSTPSVVSVSHSSSSSSAQPAPSMSSVSGPSAPMQPLRPMNSTPLPTKMVVSQNTVVSLSNDITSFLTRVLAWPPSTQSAVLRDFTQFTTEMNRRYGPDGQKPQVISTPSAPSAIPPAPANIQNPQNFDQQQRRMNTEPIRHPLPKPRQPSIGHGNHAPTPTPSSTGSHASPNIQPRPGPGGLHLPVSKAPSNPPQPAQRLTPDSQNARGNMLPNTPAMAVPSVAPSSSSLPSTSRKQPGRVCGNCRQSGHNTRTCTLPPSAKRKRGNDDQENDLNDMIQGGGSY